MDATNRCILSQRKIPGAGRRRVDAVGQPRVERARACSADLVPWEAPRPLAGAPGGERRRAAIRAMPRCDRERPHRPVDEQALTLPDSVHGPEPSRCHLIVTVGRCHDDQGVDGLCDLTDRSTSTSRLIEMASRSISHASVAPSCGDPSEGREHARRASSIADHFELANANSMICRAAGWPRRGEPAARTLPSRVRLYGGCRARC